MATQQSDPVNSLTRHRGVKVVSAVSMEECGGGGEKAYRTGELTSVPAKKGTLSNVPLFIKEETLTGEL